MRLGGRIIQIDEGKEGHSIFAWSLINALEQAGDSRPGIALYEKVHTLVVTEYPQNPQYGAALSAGHMPGGDYLFDSQQARSAP